MNPADNCGEFGLVNAVMRSIKQARKTTTVCHRLLTWFVILGVLGLVVPRASAQVQISEFMASNKATLADDFGAYEDWIEVRNTSPTNVNLLDWALTDNAGNLFKWRFPATNLPPVGYLVVFASNRDRRTPGAPLHTNFKLDAAGEYLALVRPDGSVATEFAPQYPPQLPDVSFGIGVIATNATLLASGAPVRVLVPSVANGGAALNDSWTGSTNGDSAWRSGVTGVGFSASSSLVGWTSMVVRFDFNAAPATNVIVDSKSFGTLHNGVNAGSTWLASCTDVAPVPVTRAGVMQFDATAGNQITLAANADFDSTRGTICFWVRTAGAAGPGSGGAVLFDRRANTYPGRGDLVEMNDNGTLFIQSGNGSANVNTFSTTNAINDNRWHHVAYVYDQAASGFVAIYLDGLLSKQQTNSAAWSWSPTQEIELGRSYDLVWRRLNGWLDDFRIYNRVLTTNELAQVVQGDDSITPEWIGTNLAGEMLNTNASAFLRIPFVISAPTNFSYLTLRLRYDDGFVAWINGEEVARANAPDTLAWNSAALNPHAAGVAENIVIGNEPGLLRPGTNILAVQGLNRSADDPTFLVLPELTATAIAQQTTQGVYFTVPTPGAANLGGAGVPGPAITFVQHTPAQPAYGDDLRVTGRVLPTLYPLTNVTLRYRVMFDTEVSVPMFDDGAHGDGAAGDGVFGTTIPAGVSAPGQMVRYYVLAADAQTNSSRWPLFPDPANSPEYLGTVVGNPAVTSELPIWEWFAQNTASAHTVTGTRGCLFFEGEFYDNISIRQRGGYSQSARAQKFDFNTGFHCLMKDSLGRVQEANLNGNGADPSYVRQQLAFETHRRGGTMASESFAVLMRANGGQDRVGIFVEQVDDHLIGRYGLRNDGALYKFVERGDSTPLFADLNAGVEKKSRLDEDWSDLQAVVNGLALPTKTARRAWFFDNADAANMVNYVAVRALIQEADDQRKNQYLYRDTMGDGLWRVYPWDKDFTFGIACCGLNVVGLHPFFGGSAHPHPQSPTAQYSKLWDFLFTDPVVVDMVTRRMRTLADELLQPPTTPTGGGDLERRALAMLQPMAPHLAAGVPSEINNVFYYIALRRTELYTSYSVTNLAAAAADRIIPLAQPSNAAIALASVEYNPPSGNQDEEFICLTNANGFAVDVSGWQLDGGVSYSFPPGTVVPAANALYVSPNTVAFRARASAPRGGMGLFIQGPYNGHLNAWGESLTLTDAAGRLVFSNNFVGTPSLAQQFLRVTEIMYNPSPAPAINSDAQQFEYVELRNISANVTLDLSGIRFTSGIAFNFTGSAVTNLLPGQRVLLVRNQAAFTARYGGGALLAGEFTGALDNKGETLRLDDAVGEKILEFAYDNSWYPITDGLGFSLAIVNDLAPWSTWDQKSSWRASGSLNGTPGQAEGAIPAFAPILVNEVLAHTDLPLVDAIELYNPAVTNVDLGGWFLTDDFYNPKKYRIANGTTIPAGGYLVFDASQFNTGSNAFLLSEYGESAYVFGGGANTNLTGYYHGWDFKASPNGVSFGRYVDSQTNTHFVLQSANTLGASNALPLVGPVVISEIMYHPPELTNGADNDLDEYLELQNITGTNVPLYCTFTNEPGYGLAALTNTWQLRNAVDFDFPMNQSLATGARLLVVGFNPTNTAQLTAFRTLYNVPTNVTIHGPWTGKLDISAEQIELKRPDMPDTVGPVFVPYIMVEEIGYRDTAPWPASADGLGNSLQRFVNSSFGNDPTNWFSSNPTAGRTNQLNLLPSVALTAPTNGAFIGRLPAIQLTATATDADGTVNQVTFHDGPTPIATLNASPWTYLWTNAPFGARTLKAVAKDDLGGVAESSPIIITVTSTPPTVTLTAPNDGAVLRPGASILLTATASDADGVVGSVEFRVDGVLLGSATAPPFNQAWTPTAPGYHTLSALARDDAGFTSAPAEAMVFVQAVGTNIITLVASNSWWRYLDTGTDPGTNWMALAYNDAGWSNGVAELGYGDAADDRPEATLIRYGSDPNNKYPAYYFRQRFVGGALGDATSALLKVMRDDGAVAWLNGAEVYRANMPAGAPTFSTWANGTVSLADEYTMFSTNVSLGLLLPGTNILAVEVHQVLATSSDVSFAAELTLSATVLGPGITAQPQSRTNVAGESATFIIGVTGSPPFAFQWRRQGTNLPGATAASQILASVTPGDAGDYSVVVTNAAGAATSAPAHLSVLISPPTIQGFCPTGNGYRFTLSGSCVSNYTLLTSTNLLDWQAIAGVLEYSSSAYYITAPATTNCASRFYRLRYP